MFVTALVCLSLSSCEPARIEVLTGNTISVHGRSYRVEGYEAPSADARCAAERGLVGIAKKSLANMLANSTVRIGSSRVDNGGTRLASVFSNDVNVGVAMARAGLLDASGRGWCD